MTSPSPQFGFTSLLLLTLSLIRTHADHHPTQIQIYICTLLLICSATGFIQVKVNALHDIFL